MANELPTKSKRQDVDRGGGAGDAALYVLMNDLALQGPRLGVDWGSAGAVRYW